MKCARPSLRDLTAKGRHETLVRCGRGRVIDKARTSRTWEAPAVAHEDTSLPMCSVLYIKGSAYEEQVMYYLIIISRSTSTPSPAH